MESKLENMGATPIISQNVDKVNGEKTENRKASAAYTALLRTWETDHANAAPGESESLYRLGVAIAQSVLRKCADPQRTTATDRTTVSNGGNPDMRDLQSALYRDVQRLDALQRYGELASRIDWTPDGEMVSEIVDQDAAAAIDESISETLSDGMDLVNAAIVALLEAAEKWAANGPEWLEKPVSVRKIRSHVLIRDTAAAWETVETTPIRTVYAAVRRYIQSTANVAADPRNGYAYIADYATEDPETGETALETVYRRIGKYADMGGYETDVNGRPTSRYTADRGTWETTAALLEKLNLSMRQRQILRYRLQGYGLQAIATALGVTYTAVYNQVQKIREKAEKIGLSPETLEK